MTNLSLTITGPSSITDIDDFLIILPITQVYSKNSCNIILNYAT